MLKLKTSLCALVAAAALALPASATTTINVQAGSWGTEVADLVPGGTVLYTFTFVPDSLLSFYFSFSASGFAEDIANASYGFLDGEHHSFTNIQKNGPLFAGTGALSFTTDQEFTIGFFDGIQNDLGTTLTYYVSAGQVAPVPVPAAGLLLAGAVGGLGYVARRRRADRA